ncbi:hypothetical protein ACKVWC_010669 [Pyricularia oryzae]
MSQVFTFARLLSWSLQTTIYWAVFSFYFVPHHAPLKHSHVLATFGGLMVVVEANLNALGVALAANSSSGPDQQALGKIFFITAVSLQVILIIVFVALSAILHRRCIRAEVPSRAINTLLPVMYTSMDLIFARCIYRLVEHTGNTKVDLDNPETLWSLSPILRYEVYFYVLEASLMLINSWVWNLWHPGRFLPDVVGIRFDPDITSMQSRCSIVR